MAGIQLIRRTTTWHRSQRLRHASTRWAKGDTRTREESGELGRWLTALETEMPPGDFYKHVLDVLHIPAREAQDLMYQSRASQGVA
jgi:hypothetical protein